MQNIPEVRPLPGGGGATLIAMHVPATDLADLTSLFL